MPDDFDPYFQWLGIPPGEQPPTLYRLLGVREFEPDPAVIQKAAAQRMQSLRQYQDGPRYQRATQLRTELSRAKVELLEPQRRAAYDLFLQQRNAPVLAVITPPQQPLAHQAEIACPQLPEPVSPTPASAAFDTAVPCDTPLAAMDVAISSSLATQLPLDDYAQPAASPQRERKKGRRRSSLVTILGVISGGPIGIAIGIYLAQLLGFDVLGGGKAPAGNAVSQPVPEKKTIVIVRPRSDAAPPRQALRKMVPVSAEPEW